MKPARRARTLSLDQLSHLLNYVASTSRQPVRDFTAFLFSFKAGLRAQEIAGLDWWCVRDASGKIGDTIEVPSTIAKSGTARSVPMHPVLKGALETLEKHLGPDLTRNDMPIIRSAEPVHPGLKVPPRVSANALQRYMSRVATAAGFHGVTSHSGRRTFTTEAVRQAPLAGCSLYDVQRIVGHAYADTTAAYVESSEAWAELVRRV